MRRRFMEAFDQAHEERSHSVTGRTPSQVRTLIRFNVAWTLLMCNDTCVKA